MSGGDGPRPVRPRDGNTDQSPNPEHTTRTEGETQDLPERVRQFTKGRVLGERYEIRRLLGRGGMGEVWRAFDLKLRVEVALKALREDLFKSEGRLGMLRQEVRAAREVISPNVCRIFDLIEIDGRELVSMEHVDGATLLAVLHERGPLELKEAQDIASQFLAGMEAIHKVGLVHRDIKPENIMLTRAGRVVVMDFGLAREPESGAGTVAGTPAYMAPEQAAGLALDARADVYSAGVVLAEMVCPDGIKNIESRQSVWEGVRSEPAKVSDSPWAEVIKKAVAKDREGRFNTAHTLTRALEDVTLRVEGAEDLHPYPGLASFTKEDAEYFFGREAEVEQMWRKLGGLPRMHGLVGPSGAGKSSFIQAGVFAAASTDWSCLVCTPGDVPVLSLGRALARAMPGDTEIVEQMLSFDDPDVAVDVVSRWRNRSENALVVVDQFEELFTQNASDVQRRFADLLARMVIEADVHVLISIRDDFLFRCSAHPALSPVFSEVSPLRPPTGGAVRRAVVQPAMKCGYRFEDDELVEEVLAEVEGERGALPLLAFAASRLWELRDRDNGLLTRQAYEDIGGVGGALARHAESTVDRIGTEHIAVVRELFRNLVTADGTRAVREWRELLSVFEAGRRESAEKVLRELIDARLLTSYEIREDEHEPIRRVEIIHESLLANWPRLVRWQTQDQEGAQIRDELRQAARAWEEHGRHDDRLWTGTAFREYALWRERYPGGLTKLEDDFGAAMTSLAGRRRRRRRIVAASVIAVLVTGLGIVASFWQRSFREARRAEAANLLSHAQLALESYPTAAVAYATSSLELSDSSEARRLALEALWKGPTAFVVNEVPSMLIAFSPDGQSLVQTTDATPFRIHVIGADGSDALIDDIHEGWVGLSMDSESGIFATFPLARDPNEPFALWSAPERRLLAKGRSGFPENVVGMYPDLNRQRVLLLIEDDDRSFIDALSFDGTTERLGTLPFNIRSMARCAEAPRGEWAAVVVGQAVYVVGFGDHELTKPLRLNHIVGPVSDIECDPLGRFVAARHEDGNIRLWDLNGDSPPRIIQGPTEFTEHRITKDGSLLVAFKSEDDEVKTWSWSLENKEPALLRQINLGKSGGTAWWEINPVERQIVSVLNPDAKIRLWPLRSPADGEPVIMQRGEVGSPRTVAIHPEGSWIASSFTNGLTLWPVARPYPVVIERYEEKVANLLFGPEGRWLATSSLSPGYVRIWRLEGDALPPARILHEAETYAYGLAVTPDGGKILLGLFNGVQLLSLDGEPPRTLPGAGFGFMIGGVAFSPDGRFAASISGKPFKISVWDLASNEEVAVVDLGDAQPRGGLIGFTQDGHILSPSPSALLSWDVETGDSETLLEGRFQSGVLSSDGTQVFLSEERSERGAFSYLSRAVLLNLGTGSATPLASHGDRITAIEMDGEGTIAVTGDADGIIRVGPTSGEEPHLLLGSPGEVYGLAIDPSGRWIASSSGTEIRLWPIPDLSKPPLHALPRDELIAKLKTLTNLRVVRDRESASGWKLEVGPFPGWETVPTW